MPAGIVERLSRAYGRVLDLMMLAASALIFAMTMVIGADVLLRNIGAGGLPWSAEISEDVIYLVTLLAAPWLLRQGQHIRVDIVLRALPRGLAWGLEWVGDALGLFCCLYFVWYGAGVAAESFSTGALSIKTLITPEWWTLAPLPVGFVLLGIEFIFRMHRLSVAEIGLRDDAVSAA
ncbi:MAG TPA: TRAP transporter small permease [Beijerinckiaceae bacterium]|nr:TRAP transporter small permease [Beijerinckiaceae bacterium]